MRISSPPGRAVHSEEGSMSPVPPAGARRPDEEASPRSYRPPGGGADRLAPIRPMGGIRGSIADTIAGARASLKNPSRPFTPADPLRRLSAHSLLQRSDHGPAPATPLIETSNFEGERPFTQQRRKAPLPAPGGLGGSSFGALHGPLGGGLVLGGGGQQGADVLSLDDDEVRDPVAHAPSQRPSSRAGRTGTAARKEKERGRDDEGAGAGRGTSADADACRAWVAIEQHLPVLAKKGRAGGGDGASEAARVMGACDAVLDVVKDFDMVQSLSTEQRSAVVKAAVCVCVCVYGHAYVRVYMQAYIFVCAGVCMYV